MDTRLTVDLGGWGYLARTLRRSGASRLASRIENAIEQERHGASSALRYLGEDERGIPVHELTADGARDLLPDLIPAIRSAIPSLGAIPAPGDEDAEQARVDVEAVAMRLLGWIVELYRQEDAMLRQVRKAA